MATSHGFIQPHDLQPVNFRDNDDDEMRVTVPPSRPPHDSDASSFATQATSGILAIDTTGKKNEFGHTEAERVLNLYRSSPSRSNASPISNTLSPGGETGVASAHSAIDQNSQLRKSYAGSNLDALTYVDEDFNYYPSRQESGTDYKHEASLVENAADMGRSDRGMADLEYQDPLSKTEADRSAPDYKSGFKRFLASGRYPIEQQIENKKRGIGRQRYPFVVWTLTLIMVIVFIYELVVNGREQGSPISLKPVVNPMLGPSTSALINLGARFPPCMKVVTEVPVTLALPCMNDTANPPDRTCPISDLCGFGGIDSGDEPSQWFRFITAIFLHAGIIHLALNMLGQMILSAQIEREMGSGGFILTYLAAGIFGNVLGGNFALVGVPSVGASGAIFGTVAVTWVDLFAHWRYHYKPVTRLIYMTVELVIGVAMGFIPFVDNFAHLGGFLMGLLVGTVFYPVISTTKRHKLIMYGFRVAAIPLAIILFVVLIRNFYTADPYAACSGCRYLSCIPTSLNNHCKGTGITTTTTSSPPGDSGLRMLLL